jgi:hypothetical protein
VVSDHPDIEELGETSLDPLYVLDPSQMPKARADSRGPGSLSATSSDDPEERALDRTKAEIEKATVVRMALAFAVAVKHYLRGEEGM